MKKLKLEAREVTSFETAGATPGERGTVHANSVVESDPFCTRFGCPTEFCTETCPMTAYCGTGDLTCPRVP